MYDGPYFRSGFIYDGPYFGEGTGNVMVEGLDCNGNESYFTECNSKPWLSNQCPHSKDVSIDCIGNTML